MMFAPGMENAFIDPEIAYKINGLEKTLMQLCVKYLNGCDSVYSILFYRISQPKSSCIEQSVPLQGAIQGFMSEVLSGPMATSLILDNSKSNILRNIGAIPYTEKNLMQVFTEPMFEELQALQATIYPLTDEGMALYDDLLDPIIMPISAVAVCLNDSWFSLMAEWSD